MRQEAGDLQWSHLLREIVKAVQRHLGDDCFLKISLKDRKRLNAMQVRGRPRPTPWSPWSWARTRA